MRVLKAAEGEVRDLAFSPDGSAVAAAVKYQGVFLWNLASPTPNPVRVDPTFEPCGGLSFSADGRAVTWLVAGVRREYDRDTRGTTEQPFPVTRLPSEVVQSADGSRVVSQHPFPDHRLVGWRLTDDGWVRAWAVHTVDLAPTRLTLSADSRLLGLLAQSAAGTPPPTNPWRVEVRDAATAAVLATGDYPYTYPGPLRFSPDGRQLVGFNNMTLLAWAVPGDGPLGQPRLIRNDNRSHFTALAFHPSGRHLYATSNDDTVHVYDTATWERVRRFTWQLGDLKAVAASPDGTLAAAAGDRGDVVVWDVDG